MDHRKAALITSPALALQVAHAAEQALRALQVTDKERNAILEAFRYKEARMAATLDAAIARADAVVQAASAETADAGSIPFTRCVLCCGSHMPHGLPASRIVCGM
jgi:predicted dinucleotide-utilizing enzyme